jgi:hypothetical protein
MGEDNLNKALRTMPFLPEAIIFFETEGKPIDIPAALTNGCPKLAYWDGEQWHELDNKDK